jgi:hypothetical protein
MAKLPSEELQELLEQHRQKRLQPPPEPAEATWEDEGGTMAPEATPPQEGSEWS